MSFGEVDCRQQRETSVKEKSVGEKTVWLHETTPDHVSSVVIIWHQKMGMIQSNEGLYPWPGACSLGLCTLSLALCAEQKAVSQNNKQNPAIPESHMGETNCLHSSRSLYLQNNDQYWERYCTVLVYFNY